MENLARNNDELASSFCEITGCDEVLATHYLEVT